MPEGMGDPEGNLFSRLYPAEALRSMLKECDFVVVTAPLTADTHNLIGEEELRAMKNTAYLVDVSRGGVVNQRALLSALQENRLGGAALDVFPEEPLPANSPFWRLHNVIISPHIAWLTPHYNERAIDLFAVNLDHYLGGAPLLNRYESERGY
jgi:phosphoglycerate dehydrogenase-like enzyme